MTKRSTKSAILSAVLALVICFTALIGTTFAWFTDSVTSANNKIVAGNLDVELEYWNGTAYVPVTGATELFDSNALWEAGHTEVAYLRISNQGSLALKYKLTVNVVEEILGKTASGKDLKLSDHLVFSVVEKKITTDADLYTRNEAVVAAGDNKGLTSYDGPSTPLVNKGDDAYVALIIYMPTSVGNEANHDGVHVPSIEMGVNLLATQYTAEEDSYDDQYDADATFPEIESTTLGENRTEDAVLTVGTVELAVPATAPAGTYALKVENTSITTDGEGKTVANYDIDLTRNGVKVNDGTEYVVTIKVAAGISADSVKVYHDGVEIAVESVDPVAGTVTFKTASFSPYAVEYAVDCDLYVDGVTYYVFTSEGFAQLNQKLADRTAGRGVKVKLCANIDMTGKTWTMVDSHVDFNCYVSEFDGQGFTISNLTINGQAMFKRFAGTGEMVFKDVTFDKATVNTTDINASVLTVQVYQNALIDNVDIKNSSITGAYKVAPLIGTVYDEKPTSITATIKNCDVLDTVVTSTQYDFFTCGLVSFVYTTNNDFVEYENCSVTNVQLLSVGGGYNYHANIHYTSADTDDQINEHPEVKVTNVTFDKPGQASNAAELKAALNSGATYINVNGQITLTEDLAASNVTLVGVDENAAIAFGGYNIGGSGKITYKNLKLSTVALPDGNGDRSGWLGGFDYAGRTESNYVDCEITGVFTTYSDTVNVTGCTFNYYVQDGEEYYAIFQYATGTVNAKDCTFMYGDRALKVYSHGPADFVFNIEDCKFVADEGFKVNKPLINIDSTYFSSLELNIKNLTVDQALADVAIHNGNGNAKVTVTQQ